MQDAEKEGVELAVVEPDEDDDPKKQIKEMDDVKSSVETSKKSVKFIEEENEQIPASSEKNSAYEPSRASSLERGSLLHDYEAERTPLRFLHLDLEQKFEGQVYNIDGGYTSDLKQRALSRSYPAYLPDDDEGAGVCFNTAAGPEITNHRI